MKKFFTLFAVTAFILTLYSFQLKVKENKLIGTWKVVNVISLTGKIKEGRKTITFFDDGTLRSVKDTGSEMKGTWVLEGKTLEITSDSEETTEKFTIQKLTKKKLTMRDGRNVYVSNKVEEE